jgi:hypothetical protein
MAVELFIVLFRKGKTIKAVTNSLTRSFYAGTRPNYFPFQTCDFFK